RPAIAQLACQLLWGQKRIGGRVDPAARRDRVECDRVLGTVGCVVRKHLALAKTPLVKTSGDRTHGLPELRIRDRPAARRVDQRRRVAKLTCASEDQVAERHVRDLDVWKWAAYHHGGPPRCWSGFDREQCRRPGCGAHRPIWSCLSR